jgi:SAM-dependent methyltransferase
MSSAGAPTMQQRLEELCLLDEDVRKRAETGARHELRDRYFLRGLARYFCPGSILELGASTGHLSAVLQADGYQVVASEVKTKLVRAIAARGLDAQLVDATKNIVAQTGRRFPNILAQCVGPLIYRNRQQVLLTLRQICDGLDVSGRFVCIGPYPWRQPDPKAFFSPREQIALAQESGRFRMIACFPHQVVPPALYRPWNGGMLNLLDHTLAHIASARLVWVMEKAKG